MQNMVKTVFFALAFSGWAVGASAQIISSGYECAPKNIGGEETRLFFRQQDGVAMNLSQTATFPVVCPQIIDYYDGGGFYGLGVTLRNGSGATQTFSCALEEYGGDGVKERSIGKTANVRPGDYGVFLWDIMKVVNNFNHSSLRCILPPRGMIVQLVWF